MSDREREHFRLQHCGFIFQGYNLFPALTARQQLEMVLRWGQGMAAREARKPHECLSSGGAATDAMPHSASARDDLNTLEPGMGSYRSARRRSSQGGVTGRGVTGSGRPSTVALTP